MSDVVDRHLEHLRARNLRPGTIAQRRNALGRLRRALGDLLVVDPELLRAHAHRQSLSAEAVATEISHLVGFYRWALREGYTTSDPTVRLERPRLPRRLPRPIADGDLAMAIELAPERLRPMFLLGAYAGLRACEVAGLHTEHVLWDHEPAVLLVVDGKGGNMAPVPLPAWLVLELRASVPARGWCFPRRDGLPGPVKPHLVSHLCNRYLHSIGIASTFHATRHWYGTKTYRATGRDLRATQELMRHRTPVSTAGYTWQDPGDRAAAVERLPRVGTNQRLPFS